MVFGCFDCCRGHKNQKSKMIKNRDKLEAVDFEQQCFKLDKIQCNLIKTTQNVVSGSNLIKCNGSTSPQTPIGNLNSSSLPILLNLPSTSSFAENKGRNQPTTTVPKMAVEELKRQVTDSTDVQNRTKKQLIRPLVFCGPSGSGKSTLLKKLMREYENCFGFSISHTTRKPRKGEINGKDYYFVEREDILNAIENGEFIEHAIFADNIYGTSKKAVKDVQEQNKICLLDIDIEGVKSLKKTDLNPIYIFIKPPTIEILEQRLRRRGSETNDKIQKRLLQAVKENEYGEQEGNFDILIVNDDFDQAYDSLRNFVEQNYNIQRVKIEDSNLVKLSS